MGWGRKGLCLLVRCHRHYFRKRKERMDPDVVIVSDDDDDEEEVHTCSAMAISD